MEFTAQDYNRLGEERYNAGDVEGAKGAFEKAVAIDSGSSIALNNLGIALLHKHKLDDAFQYFLKANASDPADLNILSNLVTCGSQLDLWATIIGAVEHSLSFHPENADLLFILSSCCLRMEQKERAREFLEQCLEIQPDFREASELLQELGVVSELLEGCERISADDANHPERLVILPYCQAGRGIEVGCGHRKTHENCIGIDIIPKGEKGRYGCVAGRVSVADICTSGDDLNMFADGELDFVVSRHNLEHYVDVIKTLQEWKRVLRGGGIMAMVLPDERKINTVTLDPTHKHAFTPESLQRYLEVIGGLRIIRMEEVIPNWSFLCVCEKVDENHL